ncbi:MAG: metallophosphoesterase family protein [Candidatus Omnitrophica bacterium]|nr:metallophosphoesterase family protein [Candidatus Omnitrophota bacterium]
MKIVVISDTHMTDKAGNLPTKLLEEIKTADMVIHAGDFISIELFEKIKSLCANVRAVCGNMDTPEIRQALPQKEIFKAGRYKIGVMHGYGSPAKLVEAISAEFKGEKPDIIIFGHSHSALNEKIGDTLFFNPGSPTDKMFATSNTYGIIEINAKIEAKIIEV